MRKLIYVILFAFTIASCGGESKKSNVATENPDCIEVLYFHTKKRCITCNTIEKLTIETLEKEFAEELKAKKIIFKTIDISKDENDAIATKYEVTWSSLFINKWSKGNEAINDMTKFGFSYAKNSPDVFVDGVKKKLEELLK